MADQLVQDLLEAGIHFGQKKSAWNPRMKPYIWGTRNRIHIIDIRSTIRGLLLANKYITKVVSEGKDVVFVGTKRQARSCIEEHCADTGMPWVSERWLGGTLTNFRTIRERLKRLIELEGLVESGEIETYSKKMTSQLMREKRKITRNLQGIRNMSKQPGAVFVVDTTREVNALREAKVLGIPTIGLIDTDGNPEMVDIPIPGNDDSMRSIDVVVRTLSNAVKAGLELRRSDASQDKPLSDDDKKSKRRSSRSQFSAESDAAPAETEAEAAGEAKAEPVAEQS
ncbi:MAG: 30S ribosomal protein S2 [Phycisphaerales bacterium]|nr:30S ribosomal protein S2 [Phycisphaerales bacterium]